MKHDARFVYMKIILYSLYTRVNTEPKKRWSGTPHPDKVSEPDKRSCVVYMLTWMYEGIGRDGSGGALER